MGGGIGIRGDPVDTQAFFAVTDPKISEVSVLWHTFDLAAIDEETRFVLDLLEAERAEACNLNRAEQPEKR